MTVSNNLRLHHRTIGYKDLQSHYIISYLTLLSPPHHPPIADRQIHRHSPHFLSRGGENIPGEQRQIGQEAGIGGVQLVHRPV
jgi:hypothetical protein